MKNVADIYRLTPGQIGMLYHLLTEEDPALYLEQVSCDLVGQLDVEAFRQAWDRAIERHPAMRTAILWEGLDEPRQVVRERVEHSWTELDLRHVHDPQAHVEVLVSDDRRRGFDLRRAPLSRVTVMRIGDDRHRLLWSFHHIVVDGWSAHLLFQDVMIRYEELVGTRPPALDDPPVVGFREHVARLRPDELAATEPFWRDLLAGFGAPNRLGLGEPAGSGAFELGRAAAELDVSASARLIEVARRQRITVNTVVQAAWALVLGRYCDSDDVVFGVTMSGRPADLPGVEGIVGMFLNTLPMRRSIPVPGDPTTVRQLLAQVQRDQLELTSRQQSSLADIQRWSAVPSGTALFETVITYENFPTPENVGPRSIAVERREVFERGHNPITIMPGFVDDVFRVEMMFDRSRFEDAAMHRLVEHVLHVVDQLTSDVDRPVAEIEILTDAELADLRRWNDTGDVVDDGITLVELFEQRAAWTPGAPALLAVDGSSVSFGELDERSAAFAERLRELGVRPGVPVGVSMRRHPAQVVAVVAIARAGGAYVAIDPAVPGSRAADIVHEAGIGLVVVEDEPPSPFVLSDVPVVSEHCGPSASVGGLEATAPDDTVFVTFTSGSTGRPKGVPAHRLGLVNRLRWQWDEFPFHADEVGVNFTTLAFVDHHSEVWGPLLSGRPQLVVPEDVVLDAERLVSLLEQHTVRRLMIVPSLFSALLDVVPGLGGRLAHVRWWILSGEAIRPALADRFRRSFPDAVLLNFYGMSELCGADGTYADDRWTGRRGPIPIGRPIRGVRAHVLDRHGRPQPVGVTGEIRFSGAPLSHGYLGRPELTAECFVDHPLEGRTYRTGDLGRRRSDGALDYVGRQDHQVKVRGVRIELGDVEAALASAPLVREVAVVQAAIDGDREGRGGRLVAHVVLDPARFSDADADAGDDDVSRRLRDHVRNLLPEVMVPSIVVTHDELPTTTSGKLDRVALQRSSRGDVTTQLDGSEAWEVRRMVELWREVIGTTDLGPDTDFFDAGGHSLLALRLFSRIRREFDVALAPSRLLRAATPRQLAAAVAGDRPAGEYRHLVVLAEGHPGRPAVFCVHGAGGDVLNLRELADELAPDWSLVGVQAPGVDGSEPPSEDLDEMCVRYLDEIEQHQPEGPYVLAGFSSGGIFAYEMARRLRARGRAVAAVVLLDTFAPGTFVRPVTWRRHLELARQFGFFRYPARRIRARLRRRREEAALAAAADASIEQYVPEDLRESRSIRAIMQALRTYSARPYGGPVLLMAAEEVLWIQAHIGDERGWTGLVSDLTVVRTPGDHHTMVEAPHVRHLAGELRSRLPALVDSARPPARPDPDGARRPSYAELEGDTGSALRHVYRHEPALGIERRLMSALVEPGDRVLDVGTAATGRSARLLRDLGAHVVSIEINPTAIAEFVSGGDADGIEVVHADLLRLPFRAQSFEHVLVALHGLDYLVADEARERAYSELARVVRPHGSVVFNAYNPLGILLTPDGLTSWASLRLRLGYLVRGRWARRSVRDANGIVLHQSTPRRLVRRVEAVTSLSLERITNGSGSVSSPLLVALFAQAPYYVFTRRAGRSAH